MKTKLLFLPLLAIILCSSDCDPKDFCLATYYADLAMNGFESSFLASDNNQEIYNISHTIINSINDILGCEMNAEAAGPNQFFERILYSEDAGFGNPVIVAETPVPLQSLNPGASGVVGGDATFFVDGYYMFHTFADFTEVVQERNESNNIEENGLNRSAANTKMVHVTRAGKKPAYDIEGNQVYVERTINVRYE